MTNVGHDVKETDECGMEIEKFLNRVKKCLPINTKFKTDFEYFQFSVTILLVFSCLFLAL